MRLSQFILTNMEKILATWESFARTMIPSTGTMSVRAIRDHAPQILRAIATEMESPQTEGDRQRKSEGLSEPLGIETSAATHGVSRQQVGFDLNELAAEYRALRATVLRLWTAEQGKVDASVLDEVIRFNEGVDQALAQSIASYSEYVGASRDTFLAVLGHDLRSPLGALVSCLRILEDTEGGGEQRARAARIVRRSIASASEMVTDLLEYTRTRLGRGIEVVPEPGDIAILCSEALDEIRSAHPGRAVEGDLPASLEARFDPARMRQVLTNLLGNAVQHGDPATPMRMSLRLDAGQVTIVVANRGVPIPADALQVIFNPMVQVVRPGAEPHERAGTSLGLGLYIAREIVTAHGGDITVASSPADGTTFTVRFPIAL